MELRKPMTQTEKRLFKEAVIREYKLKHNIEQRKQNLFNVFIKKIKKATPFNIVIGLAACAVLVLTNGWQTLIYVLLYSIIWITLVSTILSASIKTK